ncbi:prepilin-type N-terminal cleavage/methylation domain-containing protein [Fictibacillus aquaticus]|uniref:Prepilin-type cleavage/methylation domain-containing protein n=1 Tax=Fictibacillus aquaticus TaxID=2021314 RepID=A0A235FG81_9BACL|nr:type II secretion system protein [Fictibacillus aquaticus]OYD59735.1 hypothetical protein CGZ90_07600 [Fictibacillus aquaticus]
MLSEKGFSLIEVLISLTILSISVLAVSSFFQQANDVSHSNNNKLVATNLARMTLDRVQQNYKSYGLTLPVTNEKKLNKASCPGNGIPASQCNQLYQALINGNTYSIEVKVKPKSDKEDKDLKLTPATITVTYMQKNRTSSTDVEGYIKHVN